MIKKLLDIMLYTLIMIYVILFWVGVGMLVFWTVRTYL